MALKNFQRVEAGQNLTLVSMDRIARALSVDVLDLLMEPKRSVASRKRASMLSVEGLVAAGVQVYSTEDDARPRDALPIVTLHSAASSLRKGEPLAATAWARLPKRRGVSSGAFIARVVGTALESAIEDGSWALFQAPATKPFVDKIVLFARDTHGDYADAYLLRRVKSMLRAQGGLQVVLESDNAAFAPITLEAKDQRDLRAVAELVKVIA